MMLNSTGPTGPTAHMAPLHRTCLPTVALPLILAVALLTTGCAGQLAYHEGTSLVQAGKIDAGLAKFQEALSHDEHDARFRTAYLQTREKALTTYLGLAEHSARSGDPEAAKNDYHHVLSIAPDNEKALAGLAGLELATRHSQLLDAAQHDMEQKQLEAAQGKIAEVLMSDPLDPRAITMKQEIEAQNPVSKTANVLAKTGEKPITIEFKDIAIKQLFEVISRTSGLNFLFDKEVRTDQKTAIFLKNGTIASAIEFVLMSNQLEQQALNDNTILIYPNTPTKQKEYQELAVRTFYLTNADAKTVATTIKTIVKSRDIVVDEKLNMLIMRDTPDAIAMAEKLVALQDVAEPEVMLDVEVLEIQRTRLQNLGIQWPASLSVMPQPLSVMNSAAAAAASPAGLSLNDVLHQNRNTLAATIGSATANANVQDSDARLLTNPRIRVRNHEKAKILIGERVPTITSTATSTGFISQSINYIDVGLTLNVEPTIYLDDNVGIKVSLEVSSIISQVSTQSGTNAYTIGTRVATTVLRLKNGETDVLAGLIDRQERSSGNKIPGIGDMPLIGRLFGATSDNDEKSEIVLAITPHLIRNIQRPHADSAYFMSGTETSLRTHSGIVGSGGSDSNMMNSAASPTVSSPLHDAPIPPTSIPAFSIPQFTRPEPTTIPTAPPPPTTPMINP